MTWRAGVLGWGLSAVTACAMPDWWLSRQVWLTNAPADDYAPVLNGQVRWLVTNAVAELDEKLPGGAGPMARRQAAEAGGFHFSPVNAGQLKQAALPLYRRLIEEGVLAALPWEEGAGDDYASVNIGQAKQLFQFSLAGAAFAPSLNGEIAYGGLQAGVVNILAAPVTSGGFAASVTIASTGAYHLVVGRRDSFWQVEAWRDANGNAVRDSWEAAADYLGNPLGVTSAVYGIDLRLADPDEDGDGIPGYLERQLGLDPCYPDDALVDADGDGLTLADELRWGRDPLRGDTDEDGMGDGAAVLNGLSPTNQPGATRLPFIETFEPPVEPDLLSGQNGWTGAARVGTAPPGMGGAQSVCLMASSNGVADEIAHPLATYGVSRLWIDLQTIPVWRKGGAPEPPASWSASAFYFNRTGQLVVYDRTWLPGEWAMVTNVPPIEQGAVIRLTVFHDYEARRWALWLNGTNVARNCPFTGGAPELARLRFRGSTTVNTWIDDLAVTTNAPAGFVADMDGDSLPDEWERQVGLDPSDSSDSSVLSDSDYDGLSSMQEFLLGLNPGNPDVDGDGWLDGAEVARGSSPVMADLEPVAGVPFAEPFEMPAVTNGEVNGQQGWTSSLPGSAVVQGSIRFEGEQALELRPFTNSPVLAHEVKGVPGAAAWTDWHAIPVRRKGMGPPVPSALSSAAFYIDGDGHPVVRDGASWRVLPGTVPDGTTNWVRFTVHQDFSNRVWALYQDGVPVATHLALANRLTQYTGWRVSGASLAATYLDDVRVTESAPQNWEGGGTPTNAVPGSALPFIEPFELPGVATGSLSGQHGWQESGGQQALVQTHVVFTGDQALQWGGSGAGGTVCQPLDTSGATEVWTDFRTIPVFRTVATNPVLHTAATAGLFINADGFAVVSDGGFWRTLTNHVPVAAQAWCRITTVQDYATRTWSLYLNGVPVATDLALSGTATNTTGFRVESPVVRPAYLDELVIATNAPLDIDQDGDGLPGDWERLYGLDPSGASDASALSDADYDGLSNLAEYRAGTNPRERDTDQDGMGDGAEVRQGTSPVQSNAFSALPFVEGFESPGVTNGTLEGQRGWSREGDGIAVVQDGVAFAGLQSLALSSNGAVSHIVAAGGVRVVWSDLQVWPVRRLLEEPPAIGAGVASAFYVGATGQWMVCSGETGTSRWEAVSGCPPAATSRWIRVTVLQDYDARLWSLWVDGVQIARDLAFATPETECTGVRFHAPALATGYVDEVSVGLQEPASLDDDGDGLPNDWERLYGLDPSDASDLSDQADPDQDGLSNLEEYHAGTDPRAPDTDHDGLVDGHDGLMPMGGFPAGVDQDGDGFADGEQDFACSPLAADTDSDGLADGAEVGAGLDPARSTLGEGLIAWYPMHEAGGGVIADSSPHHHDGKWIGTNGPVAVAGRIGGALLFDGHVDGINVPGSEGWSLSNRFTLSAWVCLAPGSTQPVQSVAAKAGELGLVIRDRVPEFVLEGGGMPLMRGGSPLPAGSWVHLGVSRCDDNLRLYVDGAEVARANVPVTPGRWAGFFVGYEGDTTNSWFEGSCDEVRLYDRALAPSELRELFVLGSDPDGNAVGVEDELKAAGQLPGLVGGAGDLDGDGRVTARDRARLVAWVAAAASPVTRFTYDEEGNLVSRVDALGQATAMTYDGANRLLTRVEPGGRVTARELNASGLVTAITDPLGGVTRFAYNAFGEAVAVTDALGNTTGMEYNPLGKVTRATRPQGVCQETTYDALGRVQCVTLAAGTPEAQREWSFYDAADRLASNRNNLGVVNAYHYDACGRLTRRVLAKGTPVEATEGVAYDARGLAVARTNALGDAVTFAYDALRRESATADPLGNTTRREYDGLGRLAAMIQPNGHTLVHEYDRWGRETRLRDGADAASTEYDLLDRVVRRTDWRGIPALFAYDAAGNVTNQVEAAGTPEQAVTTTFFDAANRPVRVVNATGQAVDTAYDLLGNTVAVTGELGQVSRRLYRWGHRLESLLRPDGTVVSNGYDRLDRLVEVRVNGVVQQEFGYDGLSRLASAVDYNQPGSADDATLSVEYDERDRVIGEWQNGQPVGRQVDAAGQVARLTMPSGMVVSRQYDRAGRLSALKDAAGTVTYAAYAYTPNSRIQSITYGSGVVETHGLDSRERLKSLEQRNTRCEFSAILARDPDGNVTLCSGTGGAGEAYAYDAQNRVTTRKDLGAIIQEALAYDALGNWLCHSNASRGAVARAVNAGNQVVQLGGRRLDYDACGNLTNWNGAAYRYDFLGRLVEVASNGVSIARYGYDARNRRVSRELGGIRTAWFYDGENLVEESVGGAWGNATVYADTMDTPVVLLRGGSAWYVLRDWRANVVALTDATGRPVEQYRYSLFGDLQVLDGAGTPLPGSPLGNSWTYAGRQRDPETGLMHYRNRAYSAELGRFLQADPAGYADGMNLYAYAGNNPLAFADPYGLYRWSHGTLDARVGEWLFQQYASQREWERQRREYEEAMRRAAEEARARARRANERAGRLLSQYKSQHAGEVKKLVYKYSHLGVDENDATRLLMSGVTSIPRLGATVGPNDTRREWWLDYYLRGGQVNDAMRDEMSRMGTRDVDDFFAQTSQRESALKAKRKGKQQQYTIGAVAIVATVVTCGAGGVVGAALLGTVGVTASSVSFGAFVAGAVAIQGVSSAATTLISRGDLGDFAQSWAINSAASVAGYGAGFSAGQAGADMNLQLATQSATSTFVSEGSQAGLEGDGFKQVFRDTAVSFAAGGVMGTFLNAPGNGSPASSFGEYVKQGSSSRFGLLQSPVSGGVQGALHAVAYGGNMAEAFAEGAYSREALNQYLMASAVTPAAGWLSAELVAALPRQAPPAAQPVEWREAPVVPEPAETAHAEGGEAALRTPGGRGALRGGLATVAGHVREVVMTPARAVRAMAETLGASTWRERSRILNPFARGFAGYQILDKATDAAQVAAGLPVSFLSGDFMDGDPAIEGMPGGAAKLVTFNGIANSPWDAAVMAKSVQGQFGGMDSVHVVNRSAFWGLGDIMQIIGNELGAIDITAIRGSEALRQAGAAPGVVNVVAHSQGSMTFRRALDLVDEPALRARMAYQGAGPELYNSRNHLGLASVKNLWNRERGTARFDPVPLANYLPFPARLMGDPFLLGGDTAWQVVDSPGNRSAPGGNRHGFQDYYQGYVHE